MGGAIIEHDTRREMGDEIFSDASGYEEMPPMKYIKAPIDVNPRVNLFAIYEKRRKDCMARGIAALNVVKMLQFEYWTGVSDRDARNLYGWAKEDHARARGIKPAVPPKKQFRREAAS